MWILRHPLLAAAAATTHTPEIQHVSGGQFLQAATDRAGRDPGRTGNRRDPPIPRRLGFRRCEDAPGPLVQMGPEGRIAGANRGDVDHPLGVAPAATKRNPTSPYDPLPDSLIRGGALRREPMAIIMLQYDRPTATHGPSVYPQPQPSGIPADPFSRSPYHTCSGMCAREESAACIQMISG